MLDIFSAWDLSKGLSHQEKLSKIAEILNEKEASDITFTALEADGSLGQYVLGSIQGNTKFLMGLGSPGFHLAPYHFIVMDPDLSEKEASLIYKTKGHPAIPKLWDSANQIPVEEGDLKEGKPHPRAFIAKKKNPVFLTNVNGRKYYANPETQTLEDAETGNVFAWSLIKNSFVGSQDPNLVEKMNLFTPGVFDARLEKSINMPDEVKYWSNQYTGYLWDSDVYPLVKSVFPKPGSVLKNGDIFSVLTTRDVVFFSKSGREYVTAWGDQFPSLDLTTSGRVLPGAILNFAKSFMHYDVDSLEKFV